MVKVKHWIKHGAPSKCRALLAAQFMCPASGFLIPYEKIVDKNDSLEGFFKGYLS